MVQEKDRKMRLSIFAYHVSSIMNDTGEFGLHPCHGVDVNVRIEKGVDGIGNEWDSVYIDGKCAGNRHGGVQRFTEIVNATQPVIEYT